MRIASERAPSVNLYFFRRIGGISRNYGEQAATPRGRLYDPDTRRQGLLRRHNFTVHVDLYKRLAILPGARLEILHGSAFTSHRPPASLATALLSLAPDATLPLGSWLLPAPRLPSSTSTSPRRRIQSSDKCRRRFFFPLRSRRARTRVELPTISLVWFPLFASGEMSLEIKVRRTRHSSS